MTRRIPPVFLGTAASIVGCLACATAPAQTVDELRKSRDVFALPIELDVDRGAADGDAKILRLQPLFRFPISEDWQLVNLSIVTLADAPSGTPAFPGASASNNAGLADLVNLSVFTPNTNGKLVWGVGGIVSLPTASASGLGSDKWTAGPAFRVTYRTGKWNLGLVGGQRWSFAGSGNKPDVNQLLLRGAIRRQLSDRWYFVSGPIIVANWDAPGEKWLVPVGGGVGRQFNLGGNPWALSAQAYYNVIRADSAPDWVARVQVISAIPFGN